MKLNNNEVLKVYTGSMISAKIISERLEDHGIENFQLDENSNTSFSNNTNIPENLDVYVHRKDLLKAQEVLEETYINLLDKK